MRGRKPKPVPSYPSKPHKSGAARLRYRGQEYYLGPFNSSASRAKYARIIAELNVTPAAIDISQAKRDNTAVTTAELIDAFRVWAEMRYVKHGKQTTEVQLFRMALSPVIELYSDIMADEFGPLALTACRNELAKRYCRKKVNEHLGRIRRVWKWGVSREMVKEPTWAALKSVEGLRKGEEGSFDLPRVKCVPAAKIAAIEGKVLPPVWAMIQLQLWTGMRPGEVSQIRTCDVTSDDPLIPAEYAGVLWLYRPQTHKTEHHDRERIIFLGPHAQKILEPWLRPADPEAYVFSPAEAMSFRGAQRTAARKTPGKTKYRRKQHSKRMPSVRYSVNAYAHAVTRGCDLAFGLPKEYRLPKNKSSISAEERDRRLGLQRAWRAINTWSPNQLRHNAATLIRKNYGVEVARIILGHAQLSTTEIYAEVDIEEAARAMHETG